MPSFRMDGVLKTYSKQDKKKKIQIKNQREISKRESKNKKLLNIKESHGSECSVDNRSAFSRSKSLKKALQNCGVNISRLSSSRVRQDSLASSPQGSHRISSNQQSKQQLDQLSVEKSPENLFNLKNYYNRSSSMLDKQYSNKILNTNANSSSVHDMFLKERLPFRFENPKDESYLGETDKVIREWSDKQLGFRENGQQKSGSVHNISSNYDFASQSKKPTREVSESKI